MSRLKYTEGYYQAHKRLNSFAVNASDEFKQMYAGVSAELALADSLFHLSNFICYHNLCDKYGGDKFEIDLLLLCPGDLLILVEVKHYTGVITYAPETAYSWEKIGTTGSTTRVKNPITQIDRTARIFRYWLNTHGFNRMSIKPAIVLYGNPQFKKAEIARLLNGNIKILTTELFHCFLEQHLRLKNGKAGNDSLRFISFLFRQKYKIPILIDPGFFDPQLTLNTSAAG